MPVLETNQDMKKPVEIWQLFVAIVAVVISVITMTSMMTTTIKDDASKVAASSENHETRIRQLEQDSTETKQDIKEMKNDIRETLLILRDKADRK
jgi:cell division protein FtsB